MVGAAFHPTDETLYKLVWSANVPPTRRERTTGPLWLRNVLAEETSGAKTASLFYQKTQRIK